MGDKKTTDILLERIKYFINSIDNGEYKPTSYEFTIKFHYDGVKCLIIEDKDSFTS